MLNFFRCLTPTFENPIDARINQINRFKLESSKLYEIARKYGHIESHSFEKPSFIRFINTGIHMQSSYSEEEKAIHTQNDTENIRSQENDSQEPTLVKRLIHGRIATLKKMLLVLTQVFKSNELPVENNDSNEFENGRTVCLSELGNSASKFHIVCEERILDEFNHFKSLETKHEESTDVEQNSLFCANHTHDLMLQPLSLENEATSSKVSEIVARDLEAKQTGETNFEGLELITSCESVDYQRRYEWFQDYLQTSQDEYEEEIEDVLLDCFIYDIKTCLDSSENEDSEDEVRDSETNLNNMIPNRKINSTDETENYETRNTDSDNESEIVLKFLTLESNTIFDLVQKTSTEIMSDTSEMMSITSSWSDFEDLDDCVLRSFCVVDFEWIDKFCFELIEVCGEGSNFDTIKLKPFDLTSFQRRFLKNLKGTFDIATSEIVSIVSIQIFVPKIDITDIQIELNLIFTLDFNPKAFKDVKEIEWALISKICKELSCEFEEPEIKPNKYLESIQEIVNPQSDLENFKETREAIEDLLASEIISDSSEDIKSLDLLVTQLDQAIEKLASTQSLPFFLHSPRCDCKERPSAVKSRIPVYNPQGKIRRNASLKLAGATSGVPVAIQRMKNIHIK